MERSAPGDAVGTRLPVFTTERLRLRQRAERDLPDLMALDAEPAVMRFIADGRPPEPATHRQELIERIHQDFGTGLGIWSVFPRDAPERFLGWVCLIPLPGYHDVELGYRFRSGAWGQGYAFEASRALIPYAFDALALPQLVAVIQPGNERSLRLIARLGFADSGWRDAYGKRLRLFRLARAGTGFA
jgi:RimJ/RimL family protein N-acetyltransferase